MNLLIPEITIEECAEVIQAITKYIRFGPEKNGYDNKKNLEIEIGQLQYMLHELELELDLDGKVINSAYKDKARALLYQAQFNVCNQKQPEPKAQ